MFSSMSFIYFFTYMMKLIETIAFLVLLSIEFKRLTNFLFKIGSVFSVCLLDLKLNHCKLIKTCRANEIGDNKRANSESE